MLPHQALAALSAGTFAPHMGEGRGVLVSSACLGVDSLGNYLGNYLENAACAGKLGVPFVVVAKVYEPRMRDAGNAFLNALPSVVASPQPALQAPKHLNAAAVCPCRESCQENPRALWTSNVETVVRPLLQMALAAHRATLAPNMTVDRGALSTAPAGSVLPLTPDAVVHYRCGDNFVGHYGFVPFPAVAARVPASARTIYILAEARNRKTQTAAKQNLAAKCDVVLRALHQYLVGQFPRSVVLLQRGGDPYADLVRLADAPVLICSVSTFCLWPALASNGTVYFPVTPLVLGGGGGGARLPKLRKGWFWMTGEQARVVRGAAFDRLSVGALVGALGGVH